MKPHTPHRRAQYCLWGHHPNDHTYTMPIKPGTVTTAPKLDGRTIAKTLLSWRP